MGLVSALGIKAMMRDRSVAVIDIEFEYRDGLLCASSHDVPGLHLVGEPDEVLADLVPAIKYLFKHNRGVDVELVPASDAKTFPAKPAALGMAPLGTGGHQRYVLEATA